MLNRELQESMNLPPFINTVGGLGEPLPARRGKDEERGKEGGEREKEGEEGCVVMCRSRRGGGGAGWRQSLAGLVRSCFVELRSPGGWAAPRFPRLCLTVT